MIHVSHPFRALTPAVLLSVLLAACSSETPESMLASAKDYLAKNDSKAAVIQIKNALQKNPDLAEARFLLGRALLEGGDPVNSEVEFRKALALKHPPAQVAPLLAKAMLSQGQAKKVIDEFGKLGSLPPDATAELQTLIASANAALGKADDADKAITAALGAQPDYAPALLFRARLMAVKGDLAGAIAIADAVLAKSPSNSDAHVLRGDMLRVRGDREQAAAGYRKAIESRADNVAAYSGLIDLLYAQNKADDVAPLVEQLKKNAPRSLVTAYQDARLDFVRKDLGKAREKMQQYLKRAPDHPPGVQLAGSIEFEAKSFAQAEIHFGKLVRLAPDSIAARRLLAMTHMRLGQPSRALHALEPILSRIEDNPGMLSLAGEVFMATGNPARAEQYFKKATTLDPKNVSAKTSLALTHLVKGDSGAFSELEEIAAGDTGTRADMALIATSMRQGQFDKALKAIDALQKKQGDSPLPHHLRGAALLGKKDVAGARKSFERAVAVKASYFPAAAALAGLDMADKKPDIAAKRIEAVLAADPKSVEAYLALAELKARSGGSKDEISGLLTKAVSANPTMVGPRVALVDFLMRTKEPKQALSAAQDAAAAIPDKPEILEMLGRVQLAGGDANLALATFAKQAGLNPGSPIPHLRAAEAHMSVKNRDAAIQSLRKALDIQPDQLDAQRALVDIHASAGATDQAVKIARDVQSQRPKEAIGFMLEGDARAAAKSWTEAAASYRAGLKVSQAPELAVKLYAVLAAGNNAAEAQRFAATWIKDHPKDRVLRLYLGDRAMAQNDLQGAAANYRAVVDLQPNHAVALNNLAWVLALQKNPKALEYAEKANAIVPNNPAFMDTLAMVHSERGDHAKAIEILRKAVAMAPQGYPIRLNLARVLARSGDREGARKEFDSVAQLGDKGPKKEDLDRVRKEL